jgi:hypothetical protein
MSKSTRTPRVARRPAPHRALRRHHIAAATLAMLGAGGNAAPVTWVGADDGFWDVNSNWDAGQPGASADVQLLAFQTTLRSGNYGIRSLTGSGRLTLSGGSLSFSEASSLGSMLLSGGTLGGSGTLLVSAASEWQRGSITGSGAATFSGGLAITGTDVHDLVGRTLVLGGSSNWANSAAGNQGQVRMGNGAVLHNSGSFLDQISASTTINGNLGGAASSFSNSGTYTKTGSRRHHGAGGLQQQRPGQRHGHAGAEQRRHAQRHALPWTRAAPCNSTAAPTASAATAPPVAQAACC